MVFPFIASSQSGNYPISATPVIYPPYPSSVKFLNESTSPSIVLTLTNKSASTSIITVNLGVTIKTKNFTAVSKPIISGLSPFVLTGGTPLRLTNLDFAVAYDFGNLTGITLSQYESPFLQSKVDFGFVLYDAVTGRQVSDNVSYSVVYSVNNPPYTSYPEDKSTVTEKGIQNVLFQWQPRQSAPAGSVQYNFELVELFDNKQNPQSAFLTNKPIYVDSGFQNTLLYGPDFPPLIPGKTYVWRIQAKTIDNGGFSISNFENHGYSNYASFNYYADCKTATMVDAEDITKNSASITWASLPDYTNFTVSYRKKGDKTWKDYTAKGISDYTYAISGLAQMTTYEIKVKTLCDNNKDATSNIKEFKTTNLDAPPSSTKKINASCGSKPPTKTLKKDLLNALKDRDQIKAGDFMVEVSDVTGSNGIFSGKGVAEIWIGKPFKINVAFDKIKVNKDFEVIEGQITPNKN